MIEIKKVKHNGNSHLVLSSSRTASKRLYPQLEFVLERKEWKFFGWTEHENVLAMIESIKLFEDNKTIERVVDGKIADK